MKFYDIVYTYNPTGVWKLDGDYNDYSGLGNNGSLLTGTLVNLLPTSYGSSSSMRVGNGTVVRVPSTSYSSTKGVKPFSVVANFFPIAATTETGIVTHDSILDGITYDSTKVYFTVKSSTTDYRVSAPLIQGAQQIVGVFSGSSVSIYQNGALVSTIDAPITTLATFTNPGFLYFGQGTSTAGLDNVVVYDFPLNDNQVQNLYLGMTDHQDESIAYAAYSTIFTNLSDPVLTPHVVRDWTSADWYDASFTNVLVDSTGVTVDVAGGTWTTSMMLADLSTVNIRASFISWTGANITVETSFDNTTWTAATNGNMIGGITYPYDSTSKVLFVRVTFATGGTLTALRVSTYTGFGFFCSDSARVVSLVGNVQDADSTFIPGQTNDIGARFFPGSMKISSDATASPTSVFGLEFMFKIPAGAASFTLFSNTAGTITIAFTNTGTITVTGASAAVLNGATITVGAATSIVQDAWNHIGLTFTSANTDYFFGSNNTGTQTATFRLARPVLYIATVTASNLQEVYAILFGRQSTSVNVATLGLSQTPVNTTYNAAWTTG